jgi:hypothetical protein
VDKCKVRHIGYNNKKGKLEKEGKILEEKGWGKGFWCYNAQWFKVQHATYKCCENCKQEF